MKASLKWRKLDAEPIQAGDFWANYNPNTPELEGQSVLQMQAAHHSKYGVPAKDAIIGSGAYWRLIPSDSEVTDSLYGKDRTEPSAHTKADMERQRQHIGSFVESMMRLAEVSAGSRAEFCELTNQLLEAGDVWLGDDSLRPVRPDEIGMTANSVNHLGGAYYRPVNAVLVLPQHPVRIAVECCCEGLGCDCADEAKLGWQRYREAQAEIARLKRQLAATPAVTRGKPVFGAKFYDANGVEIGSRQCLDNGQIVEDGDMKKAEAMLEAWEEKWNRS